MRAFAALLAGLLGVLQPLPSFGEEATPGLTVRPFKLKDHLGAVHSVHKPENGKFIVVAFLGVECPLVSLYTPRLAKLHAKYSPAGVRFVAVNANQQDSLKDIALYVQRHSLPFPMLKDPGNRVADHFRAVRTPEVFVLDDKLTVRYRGRIDDQHGVGHRREAPSRNDLEVALEELSAGEQVSQPSTKVAGCLIGKARAQKKDSSVTFSNQIIRLFQNRCIECHREGQVAPFALTDYDEAVGWAETIAEVVEEERMPPWHADRSHGHFANDRRLSDNEKQLIQQWVNDGAPEGDPKQVPPLPEYVEGWRLSREPDDVFYMQAEPYSVAAEGKIDYQYFYVDPGFKEDKWIEAAQVSPGNTAVVHHILVAAQPPNAKTYADGVDIRGYLASYVPGHSPKPYPAGMAKRIPAGHRLVFQVHYTTVGTAQQDRSKIGLVYADVSKITHEVATTSALQPALMIPAGAASHRVEAYSPVAHTDLLLLSMMPHMHARGKAFRYDAIYPNRRRETLLRVSHYDYNWQTSYELKKPQVLPRGTRLHCVATYDNSHNNPNNPDPTKDVRWGAQAWDEMMIGYFDVAMPLPPGNRPGNAASASR